MLSDRTITLENQYNSEFMNTFALVCLNLFEFE